MLVEKFADGEGDNPSVCPPELIRHKPSSRQDKDPCIEMIDGTVIQIKHMGVSGKNLTARGIIFGLATEMATATSSMNFVRLRGRTVQSKGQIYLDAVPEPRNWVRTAILDAAIAEAEERATAISKGQPANDATYRVVQLSQALNPWVDEDESAAFMRDLKRIDPRMAAREAGGEWMDDRDSWIPDFNTTRHTHDPCGADLLESLGFDDCTPLASYSWFSEHKPQIIPVDINARPHTALVLKVGVRKGERADIPANWHVFAIDCLQVYGVDSLQAANELSEYRGGRYAKAGVIMDATSMLERHNAGGALNAKINMIPLDAYRRAGFEVMGPMRQKHDPSRFADPSKLDSSLICRALFRANRVHIDLAECQPFIFALRNQMTEPDGITPDKQSNTVQDRKVASFTDVFRYGVYPFFSLSELDETGQKLDAKVYA
ncbi:MAG: hypothetical protein ACRCZP_19915 [Phycicoccus sp.]